MSKDTPYRAPIEREAPVAPPTLVVSWKDSGWNARARKALRGYYVFALELFVLAVVGTESPSVALGLAVAIGVYHAVRGDKDVEPGFTLDVVGGTLRLTRAGQPKPVVAALSELRDVEVERKGVERTTDRQRLGPTAPPTELTGARDVARIVLRLEGDARVRLTEDYAPVFLCMEQFGRVRTFLRRHGWKPVDERSEPPRAE